MSLGRAFHVFFSIFQTYLIVLFPSPVLASSEFLSYLLWVEMLMRDLVITALKLEKGLALQDLIAGAYDLLQTLELPNQSRIFLLDHLGSCE